MAGRLVVRYSRDPQPTGDARWTAIGDWYTTLASPSAQATPDLAAKAKELVAGQTDFTAKIQSIASYMQRNIRYVGIEIGIGGLQPHAADDVFRNRYGDCKDKATLLRAMLKSIGIHSTWVLVDTRRGFVDPLIPSHRRQSRHRGHRDSRRLRQSAPAVRRHRPERQALSHLRSHQRVDSHRPDSAL